MLIVNYHILTMQEQCRIRKNRSLKEIKFNCDPASHLATVVPAHKPSIKHVHLQPLGKGRTHQTLSHPRKVDIKLDFTQPVPPLTTKPCSDKENRPASMNELKHPNPKPPQTFYSTEKFDSLGVFLPLHEIHEQEEDPHCEKQTLRPILKTHSRTRLLKIAHKEKVKTEMEHVQQDHEPHKTFRKGIIEHIFNRRQDREEKTDRNDLLTEERIPENEWEESPIVRKNDIFEAQCSTIKEKDQNNSSFMSRGILGELINEPTPFWLDRSTNADRRRKVEVDKFRKKFPDNFFK